MSDFKDILNISRSIFTYYELNMLIYIFFRIYFSLTLNFARLSSMQILISYLPSEESNYSISSSV